MLVCRGVGDIVARIGESVLTGSLDRRPVHALRDHDDDYAAVVDH